jgi:hypothetical protein
MHAPPGEVSSSRPIGIGTIRTAVLAQCTLRAHASHAGGASTPETAENRARKCRI